MHLKNSTSFLVRVCHQKPKIEQRMRERKGHCLCRAVRFKTIGPVRPVIACHCKQCREWSGNFWAATSCKDKDFKIESGKDLIVWFQSSEFARRAFCKACGTNLFYKADGLPAIADSISISAGVFEEPTEFDYGLHIFCKNRGDYYEIPESAEIKEEYSLK